MTVSNKRERVYHPRGFWALFATQFQGAFSDNAFRFFITFWLIAAFKESGDAQLLGLSLGDDEKSITASVTSLVALLFIVPFLMFPAFAAFLADRLNKRCVAILTKYWEVLVMACAFAAFSMQSPVFVLGLLAMMATQSAFFSPAKYGILPELLPESRLSWGNGIIAMGTFVAIILGTVCGTHLLDTFQGREQQVPILLVVLSACGVAASLFITRTPPANPDKRAPWNPWNGLGAYFKVYWSDRWLFLTMLGVGFFWFSGVMVQSTVVQLGEETLALEDYSQKGMLLVSLALGIGLGSAACGFMSRGKIEVGLIPMGGLGLAGFSAALAVPFYGYSGAMVLLAGLGFFAGLYSVPMQAFIQERSPDESKGGMIAALNFSSFSFMALGAACFYLLVETLNMSTYQVFAVVAVLTLVVSAYICALLPVFLVRLLLWFPANTLYRIKTVGREHVPNRGGALLVANHVSFIDALVITASVDRPIRFIMSQEIYEVWWIRPLVKMLGAIPVSAMNGPKDLVKSMRVASDALANGELVCIFAEGQISRTGQMLSFKKGFERINKDVQAPIIPVQLDQLWGSIFSFEGQKFFWKLPERVPYPITVSLGEAMAADSAAGDVRRAIDDLALASERARALPNPMLQRRFVREARKHPFKLAVADGRVPGLSYFKTLVGSIAMGRALRGQLDNREMVGLLVPPSVGGVLANIALALMGKVPVNLNYTASAEANRSAARQCDIKHVITSRAFLEKLPIEVPGESIYLEDVRESIGSGDRIRALVTAIFMPVKLIERSMGAPAGRDGDDLATVIFSSGSEGEPKGVMLTHRNILTNIESTMRAFPHDKHDGMMGILPFFHSFGFMATLWLPLLNNFFAVFHPNPMDAKIISGMIYKYRATFFFATPTFLQTYLRKCAPEELSSLKYVVTGAEKLPERVRSAFAEKFGIEPLEGYGTTECAPAVAVNIPNFRAPGFYQEGTRHGTIGRAIPGVGVRVVDPDKGDRMNLEEEGMLQVSGPNIMKGYLGQPERTDAVLQDGWYTTGDIAKLDEDGFITITDRLSRFSKIGGEMVPHGKIEEVFHNELGLTEQAMAIVGLPDDSKGERLVVLHTLDDTQLESLFARYESCGLPNLFLPKKNAYHRIDELPVLGSGKLNIREVKALALEKEGGS
jgi:acyl-[acyl-carrier-protein]-phospholipid O-acyltransferase/long-chain-fatty-acid--[acyl-carrier-protein] ligase